MLPWVGNGARGLVAYLVERLSAKSKLWKSESLTHALHVVSIDMCRLACIQIAITTVAAPICVAWMRLEDFSVFKLYAFAVCQLDAMIEIPGCGQCRR